MAAADPVTAILNIGTSIIERLWPDPEQRDKAKLELLALQQSGELTKFSAAAGIVQAEASSESWLASSWRPITMLVFVGLIVARWFGLAAPNLAEAEYLQLWDIVELGLGGYVIGRSGEKTIPAVAAAVATVLKK
jgi:hypothetical protein